MVRLKVSLKNVYFISESKSQSHYGSIKRKLTLEWCYKYPSLNPTMVRLKVVASVNQMTDTVVSQSHYGSIKR